MHKLRRAMVRPDRELLGGDGVTVELDSTFLGGRRAGRGARHYLNKAEVVIGVERQHPRGLGRVRLAHIDSSRRSDELFEFVRTNLAHGTIMVTDGERSYPKIARRLQTQHEPINLVGTKQLGHEALPAVHQVASLLKRWLAGTLHDGHSDEHLEYYLDEYTFRFNRRTSRSRGLLWYRLVQQAVNTDPHPLHILQHKM